MSGMAYGIDSAAHQACFELTNGGKTIGVLGCGISYFYEKERTELFRQIIESGGVVISEYELMEPPEKYKFHMRNRIIAALSSGVIIVEARENSGTLVTAKYAKEMKIPIYVVPGNVLDENYAGSNALIVNGEICVRNASDILKHYPERNFKIVDAETPVIPMDLLEVYQVLGKDGKTLDEILESVQKPIGEILPKLTLLEIQGIVKRAPGNIFLHK